MTARISKTLSALLLTLATVPALADQADSGMFAPAFGKFAQASQNERRMLRERWEQSSPEERIRMRRSLEDRMGQMPAQDALRRGAAQRENCRDREGNCNQDAGQATERRFGFGYERRQFDENRPDPSVWPGHRRQRDDERR